MTDPNVSIYVVLNVFAVIVLLGLFFELRAIGKILNHLVQRMDRALERVSEPHHDG